jgi:hypothetical protein
VFKLTANYKPPDTGSQSNSSRLKTYTGHGPVNMPTGHTHSVGAGRVGYNNYSYNKAGVRAIVNNG